MLTETDTPAAVAPPVVIDLHQLSALLGVGPATVERHNRAGKIPAPRRIGRLIRWHYDEVCEWLRRPRPDGSLMNRTEWGPVWDKLVKARRK